MARNFLETIQFGCHMGGPPLEEKELLFERFYKDFSDKKQSVVFVDIPYVIGCRTPLEEKKLLFEHFYNEFSDKKQSVVFVDIPYVIGCRTPLEEKKSLFEHFYKEFSQVFRGHSLRDWWP